MDKCPKCGNKLSPVDVLCPRCGALVEVIHVASHPNAVPVKNTGTIINQQPRPTDPVEMPEAPILRPVTTSVDPVVEEDDMPMSRQARKAALRSRPLKKDQASIPEPPEETRRSGRKERKWLEIEEVDLTSNYLAVESEPQVEESESENIALSESSALLETSADGMSESQVPEVFPDDIDALADDEPRRYRKQSLSEPESEPRKQVLRKRSPIFALALVWVVIAAAIFMAFFFLDAHVASAYGGWDDFVRHMTNGKIELDTGASYLNSINVNLSEAQTDDGAPAHRFDISMASGKSIDVQPLGESFNIESGFVSFTVADEALARNLGIVTSQPTIDTSGVSLKVTTTSQTFTYPITALTLTLSDAYYTREAPTELTETVESLIVAMTVSPDATVFINNANHATDIDDNGHLSISMPLEMGENLFVIEVIQPGRRTVKESFTVVREAERTSLAPSANYLRVYESSFECLGTTDPGASLTATMDGKTFTALVATDGTFSLACSLENVGIYDLDIQASSDEHSNAASTVMVEYLPEPNAFMAGAKEMSISEVVNGLDSLGEKGIKAAGTVDSLTSETNKQTFVLTSGSTSINCYYYGTVRLSQSSSYTFFGIADPERNSFYVMYVV